MPDLNVNQLIQNRTMVPFCRVFVYTGLKVLGENVRPTPKEIGVYRWDESQIGKHDYVLGDGTSSEGSWQVLNCRVNETRQFGSSSMLLQIGRNDSAHTPPEHPPIRPNDVIRIEMGYVKGLDTIVIERTASSDVVFTGMVDSVKERLGSGEQDGKVFTIMARDFLSILVDNKIRGTYAAPANSDFNRAYMIRDLILRGSAIDYVKWKMNEDKNAYLLDAQGLRQPEYMQAENSNSMDMVQPASYDLNNSYLNFGSIEKSQRQDQINLTDGLGNKITLMDRFPLDLVRHFSLIEQQPRELWADRKNGRIHWMCRRTDMRTLKETPYLRQYFTKYPRERVNIISATMEWSTAGTITHFTLTNPLASTTGEKRVADIYVESPTALLLDPHTGLPLRFITRNRFIYDDTLTATTGADAASIAGALFNIWGRAIEAGMVMILGDPTLKIGEAVQVFNTDLFGRRYHPALPETLSMGYAGDKDNIKSQQYTHNGRTYLNPEGIFRVEGLTHLFAVGSIKNGYKTVMILGPVDPDTGNPKRLIKSNEDLKEIQLIDVNEFINPGEQGVT
jgi:hypothetical protein